MSSSLPDPNYARNLDKVQPCKNAKKKITATLNLIIHTEICNCLYMVTVSRCLGWDDQSLLARYF